MNNTKQRLITLLLALVMIFTSVPLNAFAASEANSGRKEITDIKTVGDKEIINLGEVKGQKSQLRFFSGRQRFFGATTQQAGGSSDTVAQKVEISLDTMGLNLEEDQFDPSALTEVGSFDVTITFKELGGRTETRTMTFQAGETTKTETFYLPKDFGNGNVEAEIPKLKDNIALRVYVGANNTTNFNLGQDMTYKFELTQIIHPVIDLKVVDPYGKELQENINQALGLRLTLEEEHDFTLAANTKTFNIRTLDDFAGDNVADLNDAGDNPELSLTTQLDANKRLKVGDKTYKLNKITYKPLGQEVEINGQTKKVGGYIEFATQPKIIVPTPDEHGDLPKTPDGYKRLSFHAETSANAQDGKFENGEKLKVIDVLEGTELKDTDLLAEIAKVKNPTAYLNGSKDDSKKFLKWNPALPTDKTAGEVADTDYWAVYLADGGEITPGEKLPDGVFEVKVIKDKTIAEDPLYGKSYGVFKGSKLARDKFPDLEAAAGHKNPKWTTEAENPATGMEPIAKPWTKEITKATTFKATAAEDAATQIGKDGLKAVDTTALQGQELTEEFWHKGVALADNTTADKKAEFEALLSDATVTDKSSRTTAEAGDKVGTLLVTFKDGSTLEVPNQKLIVKPNTVTVAFDKAAGNENPLRDGDTTVKGKITASSNSDAFPVSLDGALVTIKKGNDVLSRTLANADGSFVAGVKNPLIAGEDISVVVTLPKSKTESAPVTEKVQLNPDKLNEIIPTGKEVFKNFDGKKGVNQDLVKKLKAALDEADNLFDDKGKVISTVTVDANGQGKLNTAYENIKKAIEALTGNTAPKVEGTTSHKEIFKDDTLNLEEGITVTDADGETDIAKDGEKAFTYTVQKVDAKGNKTKVTDTSTINQTAGTYEVTYTAKDKSGAEGTFVMTLVVKEPVVEIKDNFPEVIPEGYVKVEFKEGDHGKLEGTTKFLVKDGSAKTVLNAPTIKPNANYEAKKDANWDPAIPETFTGTEENNKSFTFTAQYTYIGKDVVEQKPGDKKPDVPDNFVKVEFKKGDHGVISSEETTIYWVNPDKNKTLADIQKPAVTALEGYKFTGWDKDDTTAIGKEGLTVTAQYKAKVVTEDPRDAENYAKVEFLPGDQGKFEQIDGKDQVNTFWVWKGEEVNFNAPKVTANDGFVFNGWDPAVQTKYADNQTHTAKYEPKSDISDKPVAGFQEVKFMAGSDGNFGKNGETPITEKSVWVRPNVQVDLTTKAPKVIANEGKVHTGWKPSLIGTFTKSDTATEITAQYKTDADNNGIADEDEKTPAPTAKALNVGKDPKSTTITGKAVPGAKVVAKVGETVVGETIANPTTGEYTIEATKNGKTGQESAGALDIDTKVNVTAKDGEKQESKPTEAIVKEDKDGNGVEDDKEKFNIKKATKVEIIKNPDKMDYLVKTTDGKAKFETKGLVVKFTDDSGKSATYTAEELAKMNDVTIKPANNEEIGLTPEGKTNKMDLTVTVTGAEATDKPTVKADKQVVVQLDADGNKTADEDEFSATPENVKAMNQNTEEGDPKKVTDKEKTTTTVTGKVKPGATVKITSADGKTDLTPAGGVIVDQDGNFTAEITKQAVETEIKVTATEEGKKESKPATAKVFRDSDNDGEDDSKAGQTERPAAIASNVGSKPTFTTIKGKTEKGAVITVTIKVNGEEKPVTVENLKVNDDGTYTLEAKYNNKPLDNGAEILVYATNAPKTISKPQTTTVFNDFNNDGKPDGGKVDLTDVKDIQVIAPEKMSYTQGETLVGTGLKAVVRDNKGGIEIFDYDNETGKFKNADNEEVADIKATVDGKAIKDLELTEKDHDGKAIDVKVGEKIGSTNQKLEVKELQTPTPTIDFAANQNTVGSTGQATQTAKNKTTVKFTVKNKPTTVYVKYTVNGETKEETFEIGAGDDATKTVDLKVKLPVGADVEVKAKDADKTLSEAATAKVVRDADNNGTADDKTEVGKAIIDSIKAESKNITVKPADNATELVITETDKSGNTPEGSTPITVKKDSNGNWTIDGKPVEKDEETGKLTIPTEGKLKLDEYNVVEVESKGDPDTTTPSTAKEVVGQAADTEAPAKPKVDQPVDGDKDIKVKTPTEKDAKTITVEVEVLAKPGEQPTKKTVVVEKDSDGKWKTTDGKEVTEENGKLVIPVDPAVKTGDMVTVEVKDESGNGSKSDPQTVVERQKLPEPTINPIKIGEKTVAGTAENASTVDIYKKNAQGGYDLIKEGVGVNSDGTYNYLGTTEFKDGDVIRVVAKKPGWTSNNAETTVGVDTSGLDKAIQDGKDALDKTNDGTPEDKALEKAIQDAENLKKRTDPTPPTQEELNNAQKEIEKAIENKRKTDEERQKLKDIIKEAEEETQKEGYKDKPGKDRRELEKAIKEGKENLKNNTKITESTTKIEKALERIRKETIKVGLKDPRVGDQRITITTYPSYCDVEIFINDISIDTIKTNGFGTYSYRLGEKIKPGTTIELKATKKGEFNEGKFWVKIN
ncbi:Ig-like domain-containing protein [Peptoniphilus sp. BV3AC2]|uniref:Ig-like domain-containing protein n=1 Tax=Peptoniphilus sp. BV3AC2 TaxID=1111133 RepID=UPI0003B8C2D6|nr:Ig-like domain-containing protein [Peptoniphilus sp. BV3AC2]ERT62773.1 hypothetical protein HMPREF1252_1068 [Peptoniphilus sp. BV3AC2]